MQKKAILIIFFLIFSSIFINVLPVKSFNLIKDNITTLYSSWRRIIIDDSGTFHSFYRNTTDNLIYYTYSSDNGVTWSVNVNISGVTVTANIDCVIDSNNNMYVAFLHSTDVYCSKSSDGGSTWNTVLINDNLPYTQKDICMTIDKNDVPYIVYSIVTGAGYVVNITKYNTVTNTWMYPVTIDNVSSAWETGQVRAVPLDNNTIVIGYDVRPGWRHIYGIYFESDNSTGYFMFARKVVDPAHVQFGRFDMLTDMNNVVHFVYANYSTGGLVGLFYKNLTNGVLSAEELVHLNKYYDPSLTWTADGTLTILSEYAYICGSSSKWRILHYQKQLNGSWSNASYMNTTNINSTRTPKIIYQRYPLNAMLYSGYRFSFWNDTTDTWWYSDSSQVTWLDVNCSSTAFSDNFTVLEKTITINVYNESNPSQSLTFNTFITNSSGSETYYHSGCTNPFVISMSDSPEGADTSFTISSTGYYPRTFIIDIDPTINYILNVYLAPINNANIYCLIVINEYNEPVDNVKMVIKKYVNTTNSFENMTVLYTDGIGQVLVYLIPDTSYKVYLNKTGYYDRTDDYIPDPTYYGIGYPKYFKIHGLNYTQVPEYDNRTVTFNVIMLSNSSLYIWHNVSICGTNTVEIYIYEYLNYTASFNANYSYATCNYSFYHSPINTSRMYSVYFYQNFTDTLDGNYFFVRTVMPLGSFLYNKSYLEDKVETVYGVWGPGYVNMFLLFLPFVMIVSIVGYVERGLGAIGGGLYLAFANSRIQGLNLINIYEIAAFCVAIGLLLLLVYWRHGKT